MQHDKVPPRVHARIDDVDVTDVGHKPASRSTVSPQPATPPAAVRTASRAKDEEEKPRFWTRSSSSRLNEPVPDEGADLEAEREAHRAHESHSSVPVLASKKEAVGVPVSPGSGVAAAMAKLGRESLSMAD